MDVSDPTRAVTPTLDGPALAILAAAGRPLSVDEITAQSVRGSAVGIRRAVARLVDQGIVHERRIGRNRAFELNRGHIAAEIAAQLAGLRIELWSRFRDQLSSWNPGPIYACAFGSAARGDGDESSDIDVLIVHPVFPDDESSNGRRRRPSSRADHQYVDASVRIESEGADPDRWQEQLDQLRDSVRLWTGNDLQVVDMSFFDWRSPSADYKGLLANAKRDAIELAKSSALTPTFLRDVWSD